MKEHIDIIKDWSILNKPIQVVRVTQTWGSSPRPVGSVMLINNEGKLAGSVSGGCVEGAVIKHANQLELSNEAAMVSFGVSDEEAWTVGLSCGGHIQVFLQSADFVNDGVWSGLLHAIENNLPTILISSLEEGCHTNSLMNNKRIMAGDDLPTFVQDEAFRAFRERRHLIAQFDEKKYFIQVFPRKSQLIIIGAAHIAVDLISLAKMFDFETVVIDPRGYFMENTQFPVAPDQIFTAYPSEVLHDFSLDTHTYCALLSHDPKIDDNALDILLPKPVAYIGALGSRKTHEKRVKRLQDKGVSQNLIDKIQAPIGIDINAKSAREIALSVMSQMIEVKNRFNR